MTNNRQIISGGVTLSMLISFGSFSALAQKPRPKEINAVAEDSPGAWKEFSSAEGRFAIQFPGSPRQSTQPIGQFTLNLFQLTSAFEYSVMYADYPNSVNDSDPALAKKVLDSGLEGAVAQVQSKLLEVKEVFIEKHPGRQYVERMPDGSILRGKTFLVGHRMYQLAITTPKEEGAIPEAVKFYQTTAAKFLDSFRLLGP
jgi:hypothetical protein